MQSPPPVPPHAAIEIAGFIALVGLIWAIVVTAYAAQIGLIG